MAGRGQSLEPLEAKDLEQLFHGAGQKPASPCSRPDIRLGDIFFKNSSTQAGKKESTFSKTEKRVRRVEADTDRKGKCISEPMG
jgi:hypothetical protein